MICQKCKKAGDALEESRNFELDKYKQFEVRLINIAKYLHNKCEETNCICQHKVDKKLISK